MRSARCFCSPMPSYVPTSMSPSTLALAYLALPSSQRLSTDTTPIHLAPAEAAASSCVPTATSATPMACAASAHPSLQVRDSMRAHLAPDAAVASSCVITNTLAAPMACAASAHPSLQVRANHHDACPLPAPDTAAALLRVLTMNSGTATTNSMAPPKSTLSSPRPVSHLPEEWAHLIHSSQCRYSRAKPERYY